MLSIRAKAGFSLTEVLIAVAMLAILAIVAVPHFARSAEDTRASALQANLGVLRASLEFYKLQHGGKYPGYPVEGGAPTATLTERQLLHASARGGATADPGTTGFPFGPYLKERVPLNPINGLHTIRIIVDDEAFPAEADGSSGWVYKPAIGKIRPNSTGEGPDGASWFDF